MIYCIKKISDILFRRKNVDEKNHLYSLLEEEKSYCKNRKFSGHTFLFFIAVFLMAFILFPSKYIREVSARETTNGDLLKELKIFTDVLTIVQRDYVTPIENKKVVEGSIKGMLNALDPHSGYLDPDFYQDLQAQTKGEFGGLGIEITIKEGLLLVVSPMDGSPAEKVGIRAGDAIAKIEGQYTKDFTLVDAVKKLRGPEGSYVNVSIMRKGVTGLLDFRVRRENIQVKSVKKRYLGESLGYVRINQFVEKTSSDLKAALAKLLKESDSNGLKGLILDLRNNPGGLLHQAVKVSDLFLSEGVIVYTDGRIENQKQKFFANPKDDLPGFPIVVIVNGGSASASEIVAAALKDHSRAIVLGTQSFGKGSVQTITPLENGGALTLTTALYYTKSGKSIQASGVTPDILVENKVLIQKQKKNGNADKLNTNSSEEEKELKESDFRLKEADLPGAIKNPQQLKNSTDPKTDPAQKLNPIQKINKVSDDEEEENNRIDIEKDSLKEWMSKDEQFKRAFETIKNFPHAKKLK
jgi:carboxyl-terminal processing protease